MRRLNHAEVRWVYNAILRQVSGYGDLKILTRTALGQGLESISSRDRSLKENVLDLVEWAERRGMMKILLVAVVDSSGGSDELLELIRSL